MYLDTSLSIKNRFCKPKNGIIQIERAQIQDGGVFQCQIVVEDEVVPSPPIEVYFTYRARDIFI